VLGGNARANFAGAVGNATELELQNAGMTKCKEYVCFGFEQIFLFSVELESFDRDEIVCAGFGP
jgi:hypothetical protein